MLDLDHLHRTASPLGPILRAKLRWVAADANGCEYGRQYARSDLRRAGLANADLKRLASGPSSGPPAEQGATAFARKLTLAAYKITDAEVASLLEHYGAESLAAIVHTVAYANFQDRILLALGVPVEEGGPLAPLAAPAELALADLAAPPRPETAQAEAVPLDARPSWSRRTAADLLQALAAQKTRVPRIPPPPADRLAPLPADLRARAERVMWSKISLGYQPELTKSWFHTMYTFQEEARLDRVFANTLFWVITRTNDCFY
jgi:hypothetical protein